MPKPDLTLTEQEAETAGRQMMVDHFKLLISTCWSTWPIGWRKSILQVACFSDDDVKTMTDNHWPEFSVVDQNLISNGVLRNLQIANFIRGVLLVGCPICDETGIAEGPLCEDCLEEVSQ